MENAYFIIGGSLVFVFLLWIAVGVRHLRVLARKVGSSWGEILLLIGARYDLLPILIEVLTPHAGGSSQFRDFRRDGISNRDEARRMMVASEGKSSTEAAFRKALDDLVWLGEDNDEASTEVLFLEIKKEVEDLGNQIEKKSSEYNELVLKFNRSVKFWLLVPISLVMRTKKAKKIEFGK
jgi:hypothetical protein